MAGRQADSLARPIISGFAERMGSFNSPYQQSEIAEMRRMLAQHHPSANERQLQAMVALAVGGDHEKLRQYGDLLFLHTAAADLAPAAAQPQPQQGSVPLPAGRQPAPYAGSPAPGPADTSVSELAGAESAAMFATASRQRAEAEEDGMEYGASDEDYEGYEYEDEDEDEDQDQEDLSDYSDEEGMDADPAAAPVRRLHAARCLLA